MEKGQARSSVVPFWRHFPPPALKTDGPQLRPLAGRYNHWVIFIFFNWGIIYNNLLQFVVVHRVKSFGVVNKAEVDVFLELSCCFEDPADVGNLISASFPFPKCSLNIWKFTFRCWWGLACRILSITLLACEMRANVQGFEPSLALPFFGIGMKTDLSQSCGYCWVFPIC